MIVLFDVGSSNFDSNGLFTIHPTILTEVKEKSLNGWTIYSELPIRYSDYIKDGMIAYVNTKSKGGQPFVITDIRRTDSHLSFTGHHVVFESRNYVLGDVRPTDLSAVAALSYINQRTDIPSPFSTSSDVSNSQTAYFINKNLLEALEVIETRWGGVFDVDKYHISLKNSVGLDRGYNIIYGKNLEGLRVFEDWTNVVTKLLPVGFDGITLPETFLLSEIDYGKPYTKVVRFETALEEDEKTVENLLIELRQNATEFLRKNQVPMLSYEVDSNVDQELDIGDKVEVKHPIVTIDTEVISYEYDILSKRVLKIVFGNYKRDVKKKIDAIKDVITGITEKTSGIESILVDQSELINSMNKYGHVYQDDNQILIVDKIPKETAKNVWRWNMGGFSYSENGVEGPFKHAWTMDGKFNTEFIAANSIMTNMLHSDVGSSLDLSSNTSLNLIVENIELTPGPQGEKGATGDKGANGAKGDQGIQGIPGIKGADGKTTYTWLKYATTPTSGMSDIPNDKDYVGIAVNKDTPIESTNYSDYTWQLTKGAQGIPGLPGADGKPTYTWVKYADTPTTGISDDPTGKKYIGLAHNKTTASESNTYADYSWSLMPQNITIGGRNLLKKSNVPLENGIYAIARYDITDDTLTVNDVVTITLKGKLGDGRDAFRVYNSGGTSPSITLKDIGDGYYQYTGKWVMPNLAVLNSHAQFYQFPSTGTTTSSIEWVKLERGDMATDWSPAPEDIDDRVSDAENNIENVEKVTQENAANISINSQQIQNEVFERVQMGDSIISETRSLVEQTSESITESFTRLEEDVEGDRAELKEVTTYYRKDVYGAVIGKDGDPMQFYFANDEAGFRENGERISYWKGKQFYVENLHVLTRIILGQHVIESEGSNTKVRSVV